MQRNYTMTEAAEVLRVSRRALQELVKSFTPHDCRHTWATWHYQKNRDLGALQRLGGWKAVQMVLRYAHVNVGELQSSIDCL